MRIVPLYMDTMKKKAKTKKAQKQNQKKGGPERELVENTAWMVGPYTKVQ